MARAYEKYMKIFGVKGFEHPDISFTTRKGVDVVLKWNKNEYRAYKISCDGKLSDMMLGSTMPENLKKYICEKR